MRVSFGKGAPARVTWISFLAPEMQTMEGFYPVYLFYKKAKKLILAYGLSETKESKTSWPNEILNNEKKISDYLDDPPRYGDSFVFKTYKLSVQDKKVGYTDDNDKPISNDTLNKDLTDIINYYKKSLSLEIKKEDLVLENVQFYKHSLMILFLVVHLKELIGRLEMLSHLNLQVY